MVSPAASVVVLAGGVGAARFLQGIVQVVDPARVTAIVNTGDDLDFYGLHVSPDLDIVMYTLAGLVDEERGWGMRGDTFRGLEMLRHYGADTWFGLGDSDTGTCLLRTKLLADGLTLSQATDRLRRSLGVGVRILPMTDDAVRTKIVTDDGVLDFQEYFVKRRERDVVRGVRFEGVDSATPAPGVIEAIQEASAVVLAPSNPFVSIGTILSVPGVRDALRERRGRVAAVSPIIGGAAVKGPAAQMLESMGCEVSALGVARLYRDIVGTFVLDEVDAVLAERITELDMRPIVAPTLMKGLAEKRALAQLTLAGIDPTILQT